MRRGSRFLQAAGILLILVSLGLILGTRIYEAQSRDDAAAVTARMEELLEPRTPGIQGEGPMPALELDGRDYVCLLEVPGMNVALPVCNDWELRNQVGNPCRYWGSVYESTLILGGSRLSQLDFCGRLDLGDEIVITDLQGRSFSFEVQSILRRDDASFEKLREGEYPLTIFTRDGFSNRSIVVHCGLPE